MNIQLGIDLATSVSIIGAAGTFIYQQAKQARQARLTTLHTLRIEKMSRMTTDFSEILSKGYDLLDSVRINNTAPTYEDFYNLCNSIDRYIVVKTELLFDVWASDTERELLKSIRDGVHSWMEKFNEAHRSKGATEVPQLHDLLSNIMEKVKELNSLLKMQIETLK